MSRRPLAFAEIVKKTGFVKSSCHRILAVLQSEGMIQYDSDSRTYQTGPRLRKWARSSWHRTDLQDVAAGIMEALSDQTGMNTALSILDDHHILYLRTFDHVPIRLAARAGDRAPLHCTAAGKMFLAHLPPLRRSEVLEALSLEKFTEFTKTTAADLEAEFPAIQRDDVALAIQEEYLHVIGSAAAIRDEHGALTACLSLWALTDDASPEDLHKNISALKDAARRISERIGWDPTLRDQG
jgi:DNA-binding IclR family transcriptional regulator